MRRFIPVIFLTALILACKPGIPKDIIQPPKMEKVLFDVHVVDGHMNSMVNPDSSKKVAAAYYKGIYNKFGIDSTLYNKSLDYYYEHPKLMKEMYDRISTKLAKEKDRQNKINTIVSNEKNVPTTDSVRNKKRLDSVLAKKKLDSVKRADSVKLVKRKDSLRLDSIKRKNRLQKQFNKRKVSAKALRAVE